MSLKSRALPLLLHSMYWGCLAMCLLFLVSPGHARLHGSGILGTTVSETVLEPDDNAGNWSPLALSVASEDLALSGGPELFAHLKNFRLCLRVLYPVLAIPATTFSAHPFRHAFSTYRILPNAP